MEGHLYACLGAFADAFFFQVLSIVKNKRFFLSQNYNDKFSSVC